MQKGCYEIQRYESSPEIRKIHCKGILLVKVGNVIPAQKTSRIKWALSVKFGDVAESGPDILGSNHGALSRSWPSRCNNECEHCPEILKIQRDTIGEIQWCESSPETWRFKRALLVVFSNVNESGRYAWEHQRCIIQELTKKVAVFAVLNANPAHKSSRFKGTLLVKFLPY